MSLPTEYILPWVINAEPYSDKHMDIAWENPEILRMMSNENLLEPSAAVLKAILDAARLGNLYPGSGLELRKRLGEKTGLTANHVVLGNGSTDVINFVVHTFIGPGDEAIIPVPTFPMYEARVKIAGGAPVLIPLTKDFYWDMDDILKAVNPTTKLLFICSPNNPTGNQIAEKDLIRLLELGIPTFFDEAYYELENKVRSRVYLLKDYPHMVINRTFSKAMGLAGLRLGYSLSHPELASYFNRVRFPWNVNHLAIAAALTLLEDTQDQAQKRQNIIDGREFIFHEINQFPGIKAFPSEGNFVLIDASALGLSSGEIRDTFASKGIFVRPMSGHNLGKGYFRVTVGTPEHNQKFIDTFKAIYQNAIR